jgi:putative SOS response-associated peptidase YedK
VRPFHRSLYMARIKEFYDLTTPYLTSNFPPRYNITPTQKSFVVRLAKDGSRELAELKWGLVPSWSKDDTGAVRMINARAETVARLPAYRAAFKARPCLVVADGFYEWKEARLQEAALFYHGQRREAVCLRGPLGMWRPKDAPADTASVETITILSTEPNAHS